MGIDDTLIACHDLGIRIRVVEGNLRVTNAKRLTDDLRNALKRHKEQIIKEFSMSLFDYVVLLFPGCVEIDKNGRQQKILLGGLSVFDLL